MLVFEDLRKLLAGNRFRWLVTGAGGFIGSNLAEALLRLDQVVVGLDNFSTGHRRNLDEVREIVGTERWASFELAEVDIRSHRDCLAATREVDFVLHQAAVVSVPRSLKDPLVSNDVNISGFLAMLDAAKVSGVRSFVFAGSSSVYGDATDLPMVEERIGRPLSPYAVTKRTDELYASVFSRLHGLNTIGLRYFNVFGERQDPAGDYAAVIPRWIAAMARDEPVTIYGDGQTTRDFCYVANVVQANIRAALAKEVGGEIFNVACGERTSLRDLFENIADVLRREGVDYGRSPVYADFRAGEIRHSQADLGKAERQLGYRPTHDVRAGLGAAMPWYLGLLPQPKPNEQGRS